MLYLRKSKYMTFKEWLNIVLDKELICERYLPAVDAARSRKQFMDVALDVNGMAFLCDMRLQGYELPYETIESEFRAYLNGRYIHSKSSISGSYTSAMYCGIDVPAEITINTTLTGLFGCHCIVNVPSNVVCQIYVDSGCDVLINVADNARCQIRVWDGGLVECNNNSNVTITRKKLGDE